MRGSDASRKVNVRKRASRRSERKCTGETRDTMRLCTEGVVVENECVRVSRTIMQRMRDAVGP